MFRMRISNPIDTTNAQHTYAKGEYVPTGETRRRLRSTTLSAPMPPMDGLVSTTKYLKKVAKDPDGKNIKSIKDFFFDEAVAKANGLGDACKGNYAYFDGWSWYQCKVAPEQEPEISVVLLLG